MKQQQGETEEDSSATILWLLAAGGGLAVVAFVAVQIKRPKLRRKASRLPSWDMDVEPMAGPSAADVSEPAGTGRFHLPVAHAERAKSPDAAGADSPGTAFDPYHKWLGIPASESGGGGPNHYRLLGITLFESDPEVFAEAADRQMAHLRTYQLGKSAALAEQLLGEISTAKGCLLSAAKKSVYDQKPKRRLAK